MAHYAVLDSENIVVNIIVAEQSFIDSLSNNYQFVEYNETIPFVEYNEANSAVIGYTYNSTTQTFSPPFTPGSEP